MLRVLLPEAFFVYRNISVHAPENRKFQVKPIQLNEILLSIFSTKYAFKSLLIKIYFTYFKFAKMHSSQNWTFDDFDADLKDLSPEAREKAIEIANKLMKESGYTEEKAIKEGIKKAEEWFYDLEG
jgi:hypothetical protein